MSRRDPGVARRARITIGVAAIAIIAAVGLGIHLLSGSTGSTAAVVKDMRGNEVTLDPGTAPSTKVVRAMNIHPVAERFAVPSVGLDVPMEVLSEVHASITPPGFTRAYLVRNLGVGLQDAATGTVYVVMHSIRGGGVAPGNYLTDIDRGTSAVTTGATIRVGALEYTVTGWSAVTKSQLPRDAELWENSPGRLVVITCLERPSAAPSISNLVITARLASPSG